METIDIATFEEGMVNGGIWVLTEASSSMQNYIKREFPPEKYEEEIVKYRTARKFIKEGNLITVVSVSNQVWAGVVQYDADNTIIRENENGVVIMLERRTGKHLVTTLETDTTEELVEKMIKTGYISKEEWDKYINPENHKELPIIKKIMI